MGEDVCRRAGLDPLILGSTGGRETTWEDTERFAGQLLDREVDLLLFAGGDGTARNICKAVGSGLVTLGIPAGVKIHSAVYAVTPRDAGDVAGRFLEGGVSRVREGEVMDIDEESYRQGVVEARLYGYLRVPVEDRYVQRMKAGGVASEAQALAGMAEEVVDCMQEPEVFVIGPGTTTRAITERLDLSGTLLGVDVVRNRRLVGRDVSERQLLELTSGRRVRIVITVIGGQGYILGRGNQQISPTLLRQVGKQGLLVVATKEKLASLGGRPLLVDTGDEALNRELSGYLRVITGYEDYVIYRVGHR
jgi:predicted polyphosphate/ATP-dependent NAD kinase